MGLKVCNFIDSKYPRVSRPKDIFKFINYSLNVLVLGAKVQRNLQQPKRKIIIYGRN